jgi:hypothetical protein
MYKGRSLSTGDDFARDSDRGRRVESSSHTRDDLEGGEGQSEGSRRLD